MQEEILREGWLNGADLKSKQAAAGLAGYAVCQVAGISRARLSDVERGYVVASVQEMDRIAAAIEQILQTKQYLAAVASKAGLSLRGIHL